MGMVTKSDIAKTLGVSRGCVSQVLNNTPGSRVSPELRQRVIETAKRMNYLPPAPAADKRARNSCIAYVMCWSYLKQRANPGGWHMVLLYSFQQIAARHGQHVVFVGVNGLANSIDEALATLDQLDPMCAVLDGIIPPRLVERMGKQPYPFVVAGAQPYAYEAKWEGKVSAVAPDPTGTIAPLIRELHNRGSRHIGLLLDSVTYYHSRLILESYKRSLEIHRLRYEPALVQIGDQHPGENDPLARYIKQGIHIDGLICAVHITARVIPQLPHDKLPGLDARHVGVFGNIGSASFPGKGQVVSIRNKTNTFAIQLHRLLMHLIRHPGSHRRVLLPPEEST